MKIAIDLDGTIFSCDSILYKLGNKLIPFYHQKELKFALIEEDGEWQDGVLASMSKSMNPNNYKEIEDATWFIKKWKEEGHDIIILSSRPNWKVLRTAVVSWLKNFDLNYTMLVVACNNKAKFCEKFNIDVLVDDTYNNCKKTAQLGISSILFTNEQQEKKCCLNELYVAQTWSDIGSFVEEIRKEKKQKKLIEMKKIGL